jgi:chemotaxis protein methyltransferase CheR
VTPDADLLDAVFRLLNRRTGLWFPPGRRALAETGVTRAITRAASPGRYLALLEAGGAAWDALVTEMTVGETYFFREPAQFAFLRREVLPALRRRGRAGVRAWSAGCASGEEAYSLAILFEEEGFGDRSFLLATDLSAAALERARRASYGPWSLRGSGAEIARPYLRPDGERLVVAERLRQRVTFAPLNLAAETYPSADTEAWAMDVVLCRNVLIYFDGDTVRSVARRLFDTLAPGGWLFTGASDPPLAAFAPFESVVTDVGVFYRRGARPALKDGAKEGSPVNGAEERGAVPASPVHGASAFSPVLQGGASSDARAGVSGPVTPPDPRQEARAAFERGDYARAAALAGDPAGAVLRVRSLANVDAEAAERVCAEAAGTRPLDVELHYLHAILLLGLGREAEAARAVRRVLYLDRSLAAAHFALGSLLERRGDRSGACRAYRCAHELAAARPPDEPVPLADGEPAGQLATAAAARLETLRPGGRPPS